CVEKGRHMAGELAGRFSGLLLDIDGVLYRGNDALEGATELFPALREAGLSFILLTNNATLRAADFSDKLARMGIDVEAGSILTSAGATATYLRTHFPEGGGVYVLGEEALVRTIEEVPNFHVEAERPEFVVAGLFFGFDYQALRTACTAIRRGARFIATNVDTTLPVEGGDFWPGAGSLVAAVQACSGVAPTVIGKPSVHGGEMALEKLGLPAYQVLCVGDRLDTDIVMGRDAGMPTALLLTGVSQPADIERTGIVPDYIFDDLSALVSALGIG
ncbi:MAG TPA: HAD-IIA family hydrolase, partial [Chloroflexia bacterium]|nr:HAD-IIA family hydrolase [Chloroflexia bacterium]